jgi:hypothetical protein
MTTPKSVYFLLFSCSLLMFLSACNNLFHEDDYSAYFGGEVINPTSTYVLFYKDAEVIDTIPLKKDNTFFIKFDSLAPGMYSFKHAPEYQYVYFDKNDSIMVQINSKDFDESIVFCGRGDEKNNFLMELYLKNEADKEKMFGLFDSNVTQFMSSINNSFQYNQKFYASKKQDLQWSDGFDQYAKAALNYSHYSKKELYPVIHQIRTGVDVTDKLPKDYYGFRKKIDFNNDELSCFYPFVMYLSHMLNNVGAINYHNHFSGVDLALETNINKLNIADSLIKNKKVKNTILNNIAFTYLLEDQNMVNNQKFLETYHRFSTDKSKENEILKIGNAIQLLKVGNSLPNVNLVDYNGKINASSDIFKRKTVVFFWSENASSHLIAAHKKVFEFRLKHPDYNFIAINLDKDQYKWTSIISKNKFDGIYEFRCENFEDLKSKWAITKIQRTIVLDSNSNIKNAFASLFDVHFEDNLK